MTDHRILVWGDVIDDIVVRPIGEVRRDTDTPSEIRSRPGGSAANVASWLAHSGVPVDFVGRVGSDDLVRHEAEFHSLGVTPHLIGDPELPTGTIVVIVDEDNHRTMLTQRGANRALRPSDVSDPLLAEAALTHFTGYSVFNADQRPEPSHEGLGPSRQDAWPSPAAIEREFREFFERAAQHGTAVSVDPGSAGFLRDYGPDRFLETIRGTTVFLPNADEAAVLTGVEDPRAAAELLARRFPIVVVTLGVRGTVVAGEGSEAVLVSVAPVDRADTTGAGDAFAAGFLGAWLEGGTPVESAERAATLAAQSLRLVGGRPS